MHFGLLPLAGTLPRNHSREFIAGGAVGTAQTIARMRDMVTLGKRDFEKRRKLIREVIQNCPPKDYYCYAQAAHNFCRDKIKYVFDPNGVELIESPDKILESGIADCDSIVILMATLCETMGFPCRFVTIKADTSKPDQYSHVYLEVQVPKRGWIASDPTQPDKPFGWEPGPEYPRKHWPASHDAPETARETDKMAGFGNLGDNFPGTQSTPGVKVGKFWQFRDEPAFVTVTPEELELAPIGARGSELSADGHPEFYLASHFETERERSAAELQVPDVQVQTRADVMGQFGSGRSWLPLLVLGGLALLAFGARK